MIVYNITTQVEPAIATAWLEWMHETHAPEILETGCFTAVRILQLLDTDPSKGPTFTAQFEAESKALYNLYVEKFASVMRERAFAKWGNRFISFRSLMKVVN